MSWGTVAAIGTNLLGSYLSGSAASSAANTAAAAQEAAARRAAQAAMFKPVGITTRFGSSNFQYDRKGNLIGAGYTASPEITALQDRLASLYGTSLGQAEQAQALGIPLGMAGQGLFGLGAQYLATSPEEARQQYMNEQMALLDPVRAREEARLGSSVFGRGRAGLNVGSAGQPELFALAQARREQELRLAAQAEQAAQQRIGFGAGLFGTGANLIGTQYDLQTKALAPFQTQFGLSQLLEQAAQQPLDISAQLGGRSATAGANVGKYLLEGGLSAAKTQLGGNLIGPSLMANTLSKLDYGNLFNKLMGPGAGTQQYTYGADFMPYGTSYGE
jgi:hypothetical protein